MFSKSICVVPIVAVLFVAAPVGAMLVDWEEAAAQDSPSFIATNVEDGLYDIGTYDVDIYQTYEFVVRSNADETEACMCLMGQMHISLPSDYAGLMYEQWNNTGNYGVSLFGVKDFDFGVANNPGADTHLVFVSSEVAGTTTLYVNGALAGTVDTAISLSGLVGIGYCGRPFDYTYNFDGTIFGVAIYDGLLSDSEILAHSVAYEVVPVPGAVLLGILGLGVAGLKLRKFA